MPSFYRENHNAATRASSVTGVRDRSAGSRFRRPISAARVPESMDMHIYLKSKLMEEERMRRSAEIENDFLRDLVGCFHRRLSQILKGMPCLCDRVHVFDRVKSSQYMFA